MLIVLSASFVGIVCLVYGVFSLWETPAASAPKPNTLQPDASQPIGLLTLAGGAVFAFVLLFGGVRPFAVVPVNPRALFEESRAGVTRSDVRDQLRAMENRVPDTLRDVESRLPQVTADMEREMMKHAGEYGLSTSDIRTQMQAIEQQSRQQIRGMDGDVRRQIRNMEQPVWDELRRIERGY